MFPWQPIFISVGFFKFKKLVFNSLLYLILSFKQYFVLYNLGNFSQRCGKNFEIQDGRFRIS